MNTLSKLLILIIVVAMIVAPIIIFKNPLDASVCLMSGGEWARQGFTGRYCMRPMSDDGKLCSTNSDCKSNKCVIGVSGKIDAYTAEGAKKALGDNSISPIFGTLISNDIMGKCSFTNQEPCFSGEMTINENRAVVTPQKCD
jgi:hypothetical protein